MGVGAFSRCNNLKILDLDMPTITGVFKGLPLESVALGSSVVKIENGAFKGCDKLLGVAFGHSIDTIGASAFADCAQLTIVELPDMLSKLGNNAFSNCTSLKSVKIGNGLETLEKEAFSGCTNLSDVTFGKSLTTIGESAFAKCKGLTLVSIPSPVQTIAYLAFEDCTNLTYLSIPYSVTSIAGWAFKGCNKLSKLDVYMKDINTTAFSSLPIEVLNIISPATTIGESAFRSCEKLTTLHIASSVTSIGDYAFNSAKSLSNVYCMASVPPTASENTFHSSTYNTAKLWVRDDKQDEYRQATVWKNFYNIYGGTSDIEVDNNRTIVGYYNVNGVLSTQPWTGVNIAVYSDGSRQKVIVKH